MKLFTYIPSACLQPGEVSAQVRIQLAQALASGIQPVGLPKGTQSVVVDLESTLLDPVNTLAKKFNLAPGRVVGGLLYALHLQSAGTPGTDESGINVQNLRPGQTRCLQEAAPLLQDGKIVAAECGTGSGKGRLIAHAAAFVLGLRDASALPSLRPVDISTARTDDLPQFMREFAFKAQQVHQDRLVQQGVEEPRSVILCAPSVENVAHLIREWSVVQPVLDPAMKYATAFVFGRGQFVSASQLALMLAESDTHYEEIAQWLDAGMPAGLTSATLHLAKMEPGLSGLMADLEFLANKAEFAHQDAALDQDSSDYEQTTYRQLRDKAMQADIVFTTHAMFCMDNLQLGVKDSKGFLPCPAAVFVDEAHQLENIQASMAAKSLSFVRLLSVLRAEGWESMRKGAAAKAAISTSKQAIEILKFMPDETSLPVSLQSDNAAQAAWNTVQPTLKQLSEDLQALVKGTDESKRKQKTPQQQKALRYLERSIYALKGLQEGYKGVFGHSPKRGNISFTIGPSSVERYLAARWATTPCAMLLSGTLLHIGSSGSSSSNVARELAIAPDRQAATTPVHPAWLTDSPKLMMPAVDMIDSLLPPTGDDVDPLQVLDWFQACAKVVNLAAKTAMGGTLVLMSGYDRLDGIADALRAGFPSLVKRLVVQSRQQRVSTCAAQFKEMARAGLRPIWLATGSAWTGLDLADDQVPEHQAAQDLLLTDLVMPNIPYGLDKTTTHFARVNRMGFGIESMATQRRFRQGIGRLVRRQGLLHRRIWLIDGRLQLPAAATYTADLRRVLTPYIHRVAFKVPE